MSPLDPRPFLCTRALGHEVELHESIGSTNDRAKALAHAGAAHGLLVAAESQSAGRGRLGRTWVSPQGAGVYASFVVRPRLRLAEAPLLTLSAGVAVRAAADAVSGFAGALKWPNDLWVPDDAGPLARRKVAGILVETSAAAHQLEHAVIGVGLNLREVARPAELAAIATSLEGVTARVVAPAVALAAVADALEEVLDTLVARGPSPVLERWRACAWGLGRPVVIGDVRGIMRGIADDGAALVEDATGVVRRVYAGDLEA